MGEEKETPSPKKKWSLASLICGILSIVSFGRLGLISYTLFPILAIVFGIIGLKKKEAKILSIIGIALGSSELIFFILFAILWEMAH